MDVRDLKDHATDYFRKGKFAKAADAYRSLIKLEPKELQHFIKLGDSYRRDGQKDKAIEAYREAVDGYARQGIMIKAIATCKLILEIDPAHKRAQEALAQLCAQRYAKPTDTYQPPPPAQPAQKSLVHESIDLPPDTGDSLELDLPGAGPGKQAADDRSARPLPPIRHEAPREETPPPRPPPPVVRPYYDPSDVSVEVPTFGYAQSVEGQGAIELDIDLSGPTQPPQGISQPLAQEPLEIIEGEELPPGIALITADTTAEHELLTNTAHASLVPTTTIASILLGNIDEPPELELLSLTAGTGTGMPTAPVRGEPRPAVLIDPFLEISGQAPTMEEERQAAQLAEEAAFGELPPTRVETTLPDPPSIPLADLTQESVPLFSELPKEAFIDLLEQLHFRRVAADEVVLREGDVGKSIFVLAGGSARVVKGLGSDHRLELAKLTEGAFFGEMALLNGAPRVASVVAITDCEILEITEEILRDLTAKHPSVGQSLKKFYRQRLLANVMAMSPLFRSFDKADRKTLIEKFRLREVQKEERVISEGQPPDGLYVVMHGAALVTKRDAERSREVPLALLKEGDVFGEMSLLTRKPANATVTAKRKTLMLRLPKTSFDELMFTHPAILEVVSELSEQRSKTNQEILSGAQDAPREAIAFL